MIDKPTLKKTKLQLDFYTDTIRCINIEEKVEFNAGIENKTNFFKKKIKNLYRDNIRGTICM